MNSLEYVEVSFRIAPYSEENAEILIAEMASLPFESFSMEEPFLKGYIQQEAFSEEAVAEAVESIENPRFGIESFSAAKIRPENWNAEWESGFPPIVVENVCTIKAPFHEGIPETGINITIKPQMAFGTGHHQTTYMMCKAMLGNAGFIRGKSVLDMGCGTGVLGILAAILGAADVTGIDIDAVAAASAEENMRINGVEDRCRAFCGDSSVLPENKYDVILANINRNILVNDMHAYASAMRDGGIILTSGYYRSDKGILEESASKEGLEYIGEDSREEWYCMIFGKHCK